MNSNAVVKKVVDYIETHINEDLSLDKIANELNYSNLSKNTGKSIDEISIATERDNYMTANEAMDFGLIDNICYS